MTPGRARASRTGLLLAVVLAAAPLLPAFAPGRTLYYRDVGQSHLPARELGARMLREGHLALWNPHRGNGQPFLANPNSLVFRPTSIFFIALPARLASLALALSVASLLGAAAAGSWLLLREIGYSTHASFVGACAFSLSGALQSLGQVMNHLEGVAWVPLTLWLVQRALARGWRPWAPLAALPFAFVVASGEPIWIEMTGIGALALPGLREAGWRRTAGVAAIAAVLGLLVAAAQVLPLAELASKGGRAEGLPAAEVLKWSLPPAALLQTFVPSLWGDPSRANPESYWGAGLFDTSLPWLLSLHLGAPILALAAAAIWCGRRRFVFPALALSGGGVLLALGSHLPMSGLLVLAVPGLDQVRFPAKWFLLATWGIALLACEGVDALAGGEAGRRKPRWLLAALGTAAAAAMAAGALARAGAAGFALPWLRGLLSVPGFVSDEMLARGALAGIGGWAAAGAGAVLLVVILLARDPEEGRALRRSAVAAVCAAVLLAGAWGLNPSAPRDVVFEPSPLLDDIPGAMRGESRLFSFPRPKGFAYRAPSAEMVERTGLPPDSLAWGMRWDVRTLRFFTAYPAGLDAAFDQARGDLLGLRPGSLLAEKLRDGLPLEQTLRLLEAASAGYVLAYERLDAASLDPIASLPGESNPPVSLYALSTALPRAYVVPRATPVAEPWAAIEAIREGRTDPRREVLVGEDDLRANPGRGDAAAVESPFRLATITRDEPETVIVAVADGPEGWLVLTDTYERWWRAELDGGDVPVLRANGMFRTVRIPAGEHEVRFHYAPRLFHAGAAASAAGLIAVAALLVPGIVPRRDRAGSMGAPP